jgi:hypothetical protein
MQSEVDNQKERERQRGRGVENGGAFKVAELQRAEGTGLTVAQEGRARQ